MNGLALRNRERGIPSLFEDFFNDNWFSSYQKPALIEWDDSGKEATITIEAPGFSKDDIKIESHSDGLTIVGEIQDEKMKGRLRQANFSYALKRSDIDLKNVDAKLENGILTIGIKKSKDQLSRVIPIN
jgi:HSP20 family protein